MARLKLHIIERSELNRYWDATVPGGQLFVPGIDPPKVGDTATVEIIFQNGPRVLLTGMVAWRRATGDARARPGVGIAIAAAESEKVRFLLGYTRGGLIDVRERRRLPIRLKVAYKATVGRRINFTRDLNEEGAFVRANELLPIGATTLLLVHPPGAGFRPIEVNAAIARHQVKGDYGMGVKFEFRSQLDRDHWHAFVKKIEDDYLEGRLPDSALL